MNCTATFGVEKILACVDLVIVRQMLQATASIHLMHSKRILIEVCLEQCKPKGLFSYFSFCHLRVF